MHAIIYCQSATFDKKK